MHIFYEPVVLLFELKPNDVHILDRLFYVTAFRAFQQHHALIILICFNLILLLFFLPFGGPHTFKQKHSDSLNSVDCISDHLEDHDCERVREREREKLEWVSLSVVAHTKTRAERERERNSVCVCVCACVRAKERERECVCKFEGVRDKSFYVSVISQP